LIIFSYFIIDLIRREKSKSSFSNTIGYYLKIISSKLLRKKSLKTAAFLFIPWIIFFVIFFSSNYYFFGDPTTNYIIETYGEREDIKKNYGVYSLLMLESENLNNIKVFSMYLLPYPLSNSYQLDNYNLEDFLGSSWTGILSIVLLLFILGISIRTKNKRLEIVVFTILIASTVWFYSAIRGEEDPFRNVGGRFMLPVYILSSMMYGFLIMRIFSLFSTFKRTKIQKTLKGILFSILTIFFIGAFFYSLPSFDENSFQIKDPRIFAERYPLDMETLTKNSIILTDYGRGYTAIDYDVIPFHPKYIQRNMTDGDSLTLSKKLSARFDFEVSADSISLLKETLNKGYDVYYIKNPYYSPTTDPDFLWKNSDFVVKDYSKTFCKVELVTNLTTAEKSNISCMRLK